MLGVPGPEGGEDGGDTLWMRIEPEAAGQQLTAPQVQQAVNHHATLCRLVVEGGHTAMRDIFNTIHPPINLHSRLMRVQSLRDLQRLRHAGFLTPANWALLYPKDKNPTSGNFDNILLQLLLRHVCHLSPPYPNGWDGAPLVSDTSMAANLVRLDHIRHLVRLRDVISEEEYYSCFERVTEILCNLNGLSMRSLAEVIAKGEMTEQQSKYFVEYLEQWDREMELSSKKADVETVNSPGSRFGSGMKLPTIETTHTDDTHLMSTQSGSRTMTPGREGTLLLPTLQRENSVSSRRNSGTRTPGNEFLAQDRLILHEHHKMLVDNVRSDAVLPKLVKAAILSHEEKNNINLATRNLDRMKALLRILPTKQRAAFAAFCEAIKFKYTPIYESLMKAKRIAMERPDDVTDANSNLRSSYKSIMAQHTPVPWHPDAIIDIRDFYTPLYITDYYGREWSPTSLLELVSRPKRHGGRRVVLEGESGSGKSTVCRYITTEWAHHAVSAADKFRLLYYIEVKFLKSSLAETIIEHNHEASFKKTPEEVYNLIGSFQRDVMFVLDGLEDLAPKVTAEVMDLLNGDLFPESCVLVTMDSNYVTPSLLKMFDTRLAVLGLSPYTQEEFVLRYAKLTATAEDVYSDLFEKVVDTDHSDMTSLQILAQNPQLLMCMCLLAESNTPVEAPSTTALLQTFFHSLQKLYCKNNSIQVDGSELPEKLQILAQDMEETAWRCMHQNGSFHVYDQTESEAGNPLFALGILQCRASSALPNLQQLFFTNRVFQDFMVARVLCRLEPEDFTEYVERLVNDNYYSNVTKFFCGLLKDDHDTGRMDSVINGIAKVNTGYWTGYTGSSGKGSTRELRSSVQTPTLTEGRLGDFVLSLECMYECQGRVDMLKVIVDSLPVRLFTVNKKMITHGAIMGLNHVLKHPASIVVELELRLDHFTRYNSKMLNLLGTAINHSRTMSKLKFCWSDSDLLAEVFAAIFRSECYVKTVSCFDESRKPLEHWVSAGVWSNMRQASQHMASVEDFYFANCQNKAMVTCILNSLPFSIKNLHVTNTTMDMVSAQALARRIEEGQSMKCLDLTSVKMCRPDFSYICAGLRLCGSLQWLILINTNLDATSFIALAEALKFNRSLKELDISMTELSDSACKALAHALRINPKLSQIIVEDTRITPWGKQFLLSRTEKVVFVGIEAVEFMPLPGLTITTNSQQVTFPTLKAGIKYGYEKPV